MAAITKRLLRFHSNLHSYPRPHPYPLQPFSSSSDLDPPVDIPQAEPVREPDSPTQNQTKSNFDDVKANLQREHPPQNHHQTFRKPFSFSNRAPQTPPPSKAASFEEIRRNISEFQLRSPAPPPSSSTGLYVSTQELNKKNVLSTTDDSASDALERSRLEIRFKSWLLQRKLKINPGRVTVEEIRDTFQKLAASVEAEEKSRRGKSEAKIGVTLEEMMDTFQKLPASEKSRLEILFEVGCFSGSWREIQAG